jgi:hypothetical protein
VNYGLSNTTLFWNRRGWVKCRLSDVIEIADIESFREYQMIPNRLIPPIICHLSKKEFRERGFWRLAVDEDLPEEFYIVRSGRRFPSIDFRYEKTPPREIGRYREFFERLKPSAAVRQRIDQLAVSEDYVCVQVRNSLDKNDYKDVAAISSFIARMSQFPSHTRFFLSTMDESISRVFRNEFGGRVYELPNKNYKSMIDAVADMYLLSRGGIYLVSPGSTFGVVVGGLSSTGHPDAP